MIKNFFHSYFIYVFFFVLLFFNTEKSFAKNTSKIDSLELKLKTSTDTVKINILNNLCVEYLTVSPSKSLEYAFQALELLKEIPSPKHKSKILNNIGRAYAYSGNYEKSLEYFKESLSIDIELDNKKGISTSLGNIGATYSYIGKYAEAVNYYQKALSINEEINNKSGESSCYNNIGVMYFFWEKYEEALDYYQKSLKIKIDIRDSAGISNLYNNIGEVYYKISEYNKAIDFYNKSVKISNDIGDNSKLAISLNFIGEIYQCWGKVEKALEYYKRSLKIHEKIEDKRGITITLISIGNAYKKKKNYTEATKYYNLSLKVSKEISYPNTILDNYKNLSEVYSLTGNYKKSLDYYKQYTDLKDSVYSENKHKQITEIQTKYETEKKEKELKLKNLELTKKQSELKLQKIIIYFLFIIFIAIIVFSILLYRQFRQKKFANILLRKQNHEILFKNSEISNQKEELQSQAELLEEKNTELEKLSIVARETDNSVAIVNPDFEVEWVNEGFSRLIGYTFNEYVKKYGKTLIEWSKNPKIKNDLEKCIKQKQTVNYISNNLTKNGKKIWTQTTLTPIIEEGKVIKLVAIDADITKMKLAEREIEKQHDKIAEINQNMTDSILYAERIQKAIFPLHDLVSSVFAEYFILNKPRDIVSGDFYWFGQKDDKVIIAVADCTGHGVPGAFMSMLGIAFLNEIVNKTETDKGVSLQANEILNQLREKVIKSLHQTGEFGETNDGMDIALCIIDKKKNHIQFSGANNPLYIIRNNDLIEIEGNKMPIGIYSSDIGLFSNVDVPLKKNDVLYLFSDGYADQFGGIKSRKFLLKNFQKLLIDISPLPLIEQKSQLINQHEIWKGNNEQVDDILVIGIKI
ncbi:MAG: tetratricopeptide repeat protein [Bacteroidales bacterium]|nr:tetratricopeptide repeat protein [Bacteroidales bacterium]